MKKILDAVWGDFDRADPVDITLLGVGYFLLAIMLGMGIMDWIYYVKG